MEKRNEGLTGRLLRRPGTPGSARTSLHPGLRAGHPCRGSS